MALVVSVCVNPSTHLPTHRFVLAYAAPGCSVHSILPLGQDRLVNKVNGKMKVK